MAQQATNMKRDIIVLNLEKQFDIVMDEHFGKTIEESTDSEVYRGLLELCKDLTRATERNVGEKKVYYISMEFLMGRLLITNLINMGIYGRVRDILKRRGKDLARLEELEPEPSLGNGGLGRLAACFMDSMATMGLPAEGIGLNYHFGLFRQTLDGRQQGAEKDTWLDRPNWEIASDVEYDVCFGNRKVTSRLYDIDVVGYDNGRNKLRLFDVKSVDESLVKEGITFDKEAIEKNLTLFLYPDDSDEAGNKLRIYQEYFLVSNAAQLILREMKARQYDLRKLYDHAVIQINDTHPTLIIPELIRILVSDKAFSMDDAIEVVSKTCAYTNHTILAEALETWPLEYLEEVVPQLVPIICYLDRKVKAKYDDPSVYIIDENKRVHMAFIDIHYGFSVNGVAAIHTDILKNTELNNFYRIYPEKFNNKTNGITFRRWLMACNPELTGLLSSKIGDGFKKRGTGLEALRQFEDDETVLSRISEIKREKKEQLAAYIAEHEKVQLDVDGIFDVQIKRLHEYKRQQMNALYIIHKYLEIKRGKRPVRPINFIFGAKAAPAYIIARDIIHLLLVLQEIVNNDPDVNQWMHMVFVTNYNVSYAERLIPACDVSEQISLASKEASGTSNMKFMLNGAVTLGTMDGANVEIAQLVGPENIFTFGADADTVIAHYKNADYVSRDLYRKSPVIREAVDFIVGRQALEAGCRENLYRLYNELLRKDWFMTLLDLEDYIKVKDETFAAYEDRRSWEKKMLINIAMAGQFSSDRTIAEYDKDIWKLEG